MALPPGVVHLKQETFTAHYFLAPALRESDPGSVQYIEDQVVNRINELAVFHGYQDRNVRKTFPVTWKGNVCTASVRFAKGLDLHWPTDED